MLGNTSPILRDTSILKSSNLYREGERDQHRVPCLLIEELALREKKREKVEVEENQGWPQNFN